MVYECKHFATSSVSCIYVDVNVNSNACGMPKVTGVHEVTVPVLAAIPYILTPQQIF